MTHHSEPFVWSDAWLLLALIPASADGPANRAKIIDAGDYINRDIFTDAVSPGRLPPEREWYDAGRGREVCQRAGGYRSADA